MTSSTLDRFDLKILSRIQHEGDIGPARLSEAIHLSPSQCSRRLQRLKDAGYIRDVVARLRPDMLNLNVSAYLIVKLRDHSAATEQRFQEVVANLPEILSAEYVAGEADYILRIFTHSLESYSSFLTEKLLSGIDVESVRSNIVLKTMKESTALPLDHC